MARRWSRLHIIGNRTMLTKNKLFIIRKSIYRPTQNPKLLLQLTEFPDQHPYKAHFFKLNFQLTVNVSHSNTKEDNLSCVLCCDDDSFGPGDTVEGTHRLLFRVKVFFRLCVSWIIWRRVWQLTDCELVLEVFLFNEVEKIPWPMRVLIGVTYLRLSQYTR